VSLFNAYTGPWSEWSLSANEALLFNNRALFNLQSPLAHKQCWLYVWGRCLFVCFNLKPQKLIEGPTDDK